jgi:Glu-tRNA(Gln) amidotransferase subunit E-like FAD-binding protein
MKIMMRVTLSSLLGFFGFACAGRSENQRPQTQMVNAADLKPNEIQHEQLSEGQLQRIKKLYETFAEVDSSSLEKWIDNFKRDANPDSEIAIWERVASAYTYYCSRRQLTLEAKRDVFQALVLRSMTSDEKAVKTLKLKVLSADEARNIMKQY